MKNNPTGRLALALTVAAGALNGVALAQSDTTGAQTLSAGGANVTDEALPWHPSVVRGELSNGLKYMVMRHANPPGRAAVWMHIDTGSLNETDAQRGGAHFLEHMAFNGSKNFEPGSLIPYFESLGLTFGRDQNAFTSFDQTVYQLRMPDTRPETFNKAFTFFSDVLSNLLLGDKEIDSERQIIMEEKATRKGAQQRIGEIRLKTMAPGSLLGERIVIGVDETILGMSRQDFLDYYTKFYVPSNTTLMVVADEDPAKVVPLIEAAFKEPTAKVAKPARQDAKVKPYDKTFSVVASDPELTRAQVGISRLMNPLGGATTIGEYRRDLVQSLASIAFNRRMEDKKSEGTLKMLGASAGVQELAGIARIAAVTATGEPVLWKQILADIGLELQRARTFGFTDREIEEVKKDTLSRAQQAASTEATIPAQGIIGSMNSSIASGEPYMSSAQRLEIVGQLLPTISGSEISEQFRTEFEPKAVMFFLALPTNADVPTEAQLTELGLAALSVKPEADKETARATSLLAKIPEMGSVAESSVHTPTGIWSGWLKNGARVHYRFMDYRKNTAGISITLLGKPLQETAANRGVTSAALAALGRQPASRSLSSNDIRSIMSGKKVRVGPSGGSDSIQISVSGQPEDFEAGMQLAYLLLTEPKIEQSAFDDWKTATLQSIEASEKDPSQLFGRMIPDAVYPEGEVRTRPLTADQVKAVTIEAAQAWLDDAMKTSPIEVAFVGDMKQEAVIPLVERYIGSLAVRPRVAPDAFTALRTITKPAEPRTVKRTIDTTTDLGGAMVAFYGPDETNLDDARAMSMAARVLSSRMVQEIREKAQLVYSIRSNSNPGSTFPGFGVFSAASQTQPQKADALIVKIQEMFGAFAKDGPTDTELTVAKTQTAKAMDESMKEPGFWMNQMEASTYDRTNFDDVLAEPEMAQALTADQIRTTFAKYWKDGKTIVVEVMPAKVDAPTK